MKNVGAIFKNSISVPANAVGLYPINAQEAGLKALEEAFNNRIYKKVPAEDLVNMANFIQI